ncbi:MAG: malate/L-lactate dehydrogenase [Parcubacteria group bacterium Gr01-1014_70]|nr:MAG: malate/L-lactate dehydrogenase [Parcubacteria group bacterium Gr01-1014_70]
MIMDSKQKLIEAKTLRQFLTRLFKKAGMLQSHALQVAEGLVATSLRGVDSHGIRLAPHYVKEVVAGRINPRPSFAFHKNAPGAGIVDADDSLGIPAGIFAIDQCMKLSKKTGIAAVAVKNSSHFGAAALYALRAARKGYLAFAFTHTESLVVPFGAKRPVLGTNPICIAAPCAGEDPVCIDMSTTNVTWNKLQMLKAAKATIPAGWALDKEGRVTTDYRAAEFLTPIAGYKGYGLGLMVEILSGVLAGGKLGPELTPMSPINSKKRELGHFFMIIDIAAFDSLSRFKRRMKSLATLLRSQRPAQGVRNVFVAGDPEKIMYRKRSKAGILVDASLIEEFNNLSKQFGIASI